MKRYYFSQLLLLVLVSALAVRAQDPAADGLPPTTDDVIPAGYVTPAPVEPAYVPATAPVYVPAAPACLLPDISVIGNIKGTLADDGIDAETNRSLQLDEIEVVMGSCIYPGVRADLVLAAGAKEEAGVEEAYLTVAQFAPGVPVGARLGTVRLPFGKINPQHPHCLPFVDTPSVISDLLGDEFRGNGFELIGLAPVRCPFFLQAQLGRWKNLEDPYEGAGFSEENAFTLGRVWTGTAIGPHTEIELGASGAEGDGAYDPETETYLRNVSLVGGDFTLRTWLSGERRLLLQSEYIARDQYVQSHGYYVLGTYRPHPCYEIGSRYDWSEFADDNTQHESYVSLFATRFLNEMTYVRLQAKHGTDRDGESVHELLAQVVFGFGPHVHLLQ